MKITRYDIGGGGEDGIQADIADNGDWCRWEDVAALAKEEEASDSNKAACPLCGSTDLSWNCQPVNLGGAQDGRIKMNEVGVKFFLGCNECSETVAIIDADEVVLNLPMAAT